MQGQEEAGAVPPTQRDKHSTRLALSPARIYRLTPDKHACVWTVGGNQ